MCASFLRRKEALRGLDYCSVESLFQETKAGEKYDSLCHKSRAVKASFLSIIIIIIILCY